jgi:hypothetical protein
VREVIGRVIEQPGVRVTAVPEVPDVGISDGEVAGEDGYLLVR